jgi:hypothetical protein
MSVNIPSPEAPCLAIQNKKTKTQKIIQYYIPEDCTADTNVRVTNLTKLNLNTLHFKQLHNNVT